MRELREENIFHLIGILGYKREEFYSKRKRSFSSINFFLQTIERNGGIRVTDGELGYVRSK